MDFLKNILFEKFSLPGSFNRSITENLREMNAMIMFFPKDDKRKFSSSLQRISLEENYFQFQMSLCRFLEVQHACMKISWKQQDFRTFVTMEKEINASFYAKKLTTYNLDYPITTLIKNSSE